MRVPPSSPPSPRTPRAPRWLKRLFFAARITHADAYHVAPACEDKVEHAHSLIQIGKVGTTQGMNMGRQIGVPQAVLARSHPATTELTYEGDEAVWSFTWELESTERPHGWFVISADCALEQYNAKVSDMQYEITMLNPGDSHLPADELGLPLFYYTSWFVMVGYGGYCLTLVKKHLAETRQKIHLVVKLLMVSSLAQSAVAPVISRSFYDRVLVIAVGVRAAVPVADLRDHPPLALHGQRPGVVLHGLYLRAHGGPGEYYPLDPRLTRRGLCCLRVKVSDRRVGCCVRSFITVVAGDLIRADLPRVWLDARGERGRRSEDKQRRDDAQGPACAVQGI